mmetsp:Transcript_26266/g.74730  ORF Transcript_26266/g.74730 Transcript_26266/m.74730 type:complete len:291 (+) Transcript_26266:631-1503(+)
MLLNTATKAPGPKASKKMYTAITGSTSAVRRMTPGSSEKRRPHSHRRAVTATATAAEITATRTRATWAVRRAVTWSAAPRLLPQRVPAAMEKPKCTIKPMTMVLDRMGKTSSSKQPSSPLQRSPAKNKLISQPHHSQSIKAPPGSDILRISPHSLNALRKLQQGHASGWGRTRRAATYISTACKALPSDREIGAPTNPKRAMSGENAAIEAKLATMLRAMGATITFCAWQNTLRSSFTTRKGSAGRRQNTKSAVNAATWAGCFAASKMASVLYHTTPTAITTRRWIASCR